MERMSEGKCTAFDFRTKAPGSCPKFQYCIPSGTKYGGCFNALKGHCTESSRWDLGHVVGSGQMQDVTEDGQCVEAQCPEFTSRPS